MESDRGGANTEIPVADKDYKVQFAFTGTLDKLTLGIDRPKLSPEDDELLGEAAKHD